MANSIARTFSWSVDGGNFTGSSVTDTNNALVRINDLAVSGPVTSREYDVTIPFASISSIVIYCSVDAVLKTNTASPGDDTLTLLAGVAEFGNQNTKAFTTDVTKLFLTVAGSDPFDFRVDCLLDSTP